MRTLVIVVPDLHDLGCRTIQPFEYYLFPSNVDNADILQDNILNTDFILKNSKKISAIEATKCQAEKVIELYFAV